MKLDRLHIETAPGLPNGLPEVELGGGLTVIVGPNASGKSTLARVLRQLLWPDAESSGATARSYWHATDHVHTAGIFAGEVRWDPRPTTPIPLGAAGLARFGIQTLLAVADRDDRQLGQRVARELAGGLDLAAARDLFDRPALLRKNTQLAKQREEADRDLALAKKQTRELADKEHLHARLEVQVEAAGEAGRHEAAAEALLEYALSEALVVGLELVEFPVGLDQLVGNESTRVQELEREIEKQEAELSRIESELADQRALAEANAFPAAAPRRQDLEAWSERLDELKDSGSKLEDLRIELASATQQLERRRANLTTDAGATELEPTALRKLGASIGALREAQGELAAGRGAVAMWESWAQGPTSDLELLREADRQLRAWLRAPRAQHSAEPDAPTALAWSLVAAGLVSAGAAFALAAPWLWAGLALSGVGATLLWSARNPHAAEGGAGARKLAEEACARTGHAPPRWDVDAVEDHLTQLQARLAECEQVRRASDQLTEARRAEAEARAQVEARTDALHELADRLGVERSFAELGAVDQVHALGDWLDTRAQHLKLSEHVEQRGRHVAAELAQCAEWLATLGQDAPSDVAAASAARRLVERKDAALKAAGNEILRAERERDRHEQLRTEAAQAADTLWEDAGVERGDLAGLVQRLEQREAWAAHASELRDARSDRDRCRQRFEQAGTLPQLAGIEPEAVSPEQAREWIAALGAEAKLYGDLKSETGGIAKELKLATEGHSLEDALAAKLRAKQAIATEREEAVVDALARSLLDAAREQHESAHAPPTLQRAQERFAQFTRDGWRLEVGADGTFRAHDLGAGQSRSLAELSDGTRAQLLLAVRLAALEELEAEGEPLPVCLDEALSISDPVRFRTIAEALFELADGGRQILYFTADHGEVAQWQRACEELGRPALEVIDLEHLRGAARDWGGELHALPPAIDPVPDPADQTPEQYAQALNLPPPDGFLGVATWHLYYCAHDDLDALAACLRRRLTTIGHWRGACERGVTPGVIPSAVARRLSARADLAGALAEAWRTGRGRPVTWDDLMASDAITSNFEERVRPLLAEHARDPREFVTQVRDISGFRKKKLEELSTYLEQVGCLPLEPTLADEDLTRRTLQAAPEATELLGPERAASFVSWLAGLLWV